MENLLKNYPYFREDVEADIETLGLVDDIRYCENGDTGVEYASVNFSVWTGASRLVFPYRDKLVCKLPVTKKVWYEEGEVGEWLEEQEVSDVDDHCYIECDNYESAIKEGVDKAFAPCQYFDDIKGIPVYVMIKAQPLRRMKSPSKETKEAYESDELDYSWDVNLWQLFVDYYGLEFCKKLTTFLQDHDINDIRPDNCGEIDGRPVLIDYAGYWGGY